MNARARAVRNEFAYLSALAEAPVEGVNGSEGVSGGNTTTPPFANPSGVSTINYLVIRQPKRSTRKATTRASVYSLHCEFVPLG